MKVIILAALVASISAASWWGSSSEEDEGFVAHTEYQSGKEYVYKYESQVLSSLPSFTNSHGGIKIISKRVKIDFKSSTNGVLQMTECQILTLNHEISNPADLPPTKQLPVDRFTPLPSSDASLIKSKLELPVKFKYENGKITSIEITDQETNWSIDLKRSILSMLQIRLQADSSSNPNLSFNDLSETNSTVFNFLEPALDGTCYSGVSVRRSFNSTQDNQYRIMKTRDPVNCVKQNSLYKVTWPQSLPHCECDSNLNEKECKCTPVPEEYRTSNPAYFDAKTLSEYDVVSSDQEKLLIKRCAQSATYRYEFPNYPDQYLATFSNQTLQLREQKDDQTIQTRSYSFQSVSEPWRQQVLTDDEEKPMMTAEQIVKKAKSLIDEMITLSTDPSRFDDHLPVFYQLVENFRLFKNDQLEQLFREYDARDNYRKWKVTVDALAHCNTTACDNFLLEKIAAGGNAFPLNEATPIFMIWASNKVPTPTVLDKFNKRVIPALEGKSEKTAYYHSLMCFGSMIRRYIHSEEMQKKMCVLKQDKQLHQKHIDDCRKHEELIENKLNKRDSDEKKIAVLKALTNLGSLESLTKLQEMMAKTESTAVRVHAIYAVRNLCSQNRLKVLQTVSPLLMDVSEDSEVRMASFIYFLATTNGSTTQLPKLIDQEPDLDLKTFFVRYLQTILKSKYAHDQVRVQNAKRVLSQVRAFQMSANTGRFEMKYGLRPDTNGDILNWQWLTNQTSPVPRTAIIQHRNVIRGHPRLNFEIGYRAEGFERLFSELTEKYASGKAHSDINILDSIVSRVRSWKKDGVKPQLTLHLRADGQQVAFIHLDADTINRHMLEAVTRGQMEIPVKYFQTYVAKTEQNKKLQQTGMWHVSERTNVGVIDINGTLIIRSPAQGELLPNISFGSEKMFRHEKKTILTQYVRTGFAKTGVATSMLTRNFIGEQRWNVSYSFQQQNLTFNVSHNNTPILLTNLEANTNTFVVPMRLPTIVRRKQEAFKEIVTDDPQRVKFDTEIESFKSVQLKAQVQGDVCAPEFYAFVRDRLHLLPSILSIKKQQIQFTIKPATPAQRNYTLTQSIRTLHNEIASTPSESSSGSQEESVERVQKNSWGMSGLFGRFFQSSSKDASSSEEIDYVTSDKYNPLNELRIGSIRTLWQGRIDSRYHDKVLSMVANLTTQYEHDRPTVHTVLSCERPPIPGQENDKYVFTLVGSRDFNPSANQIVGQHTLAWGEKSDPTKSTIKVAEECKAQYKDNECYEQSAYGCKDRYGVFYPLWYNHTAVFEQSNTDLLSKTLRVVTPFYVNHGEKVWVKPINNTEWNRNKINVTQIYRPNEAMVDVSYQLNNQTWNISRIYMPVESALQEAYRINPMYPLGLYRPVAHYRSGHQQVDPFFSRDTCVYENARVSSMDFKQIVNPKTDCEMVLLGDCAMDKKQLMVSVKQAVTDRTVEKKTLKVILGSSKIEIELVPGNSYSSPSIKIRVNGRQMNLDSNDQLLVQQQQRTVAIIECSDKQCEIKSSQHGIYVRINEQRVKVEADNGRARYMCGVCAPHPEVRSEQANYQQSVQIFKNNRNQNQQCNIEENAEKSRKFQEQHSCQRLHKHKVVSAISGGHLKTCVTTDRVQLCSRHCDQKALRYDHLPVRCVDREEAQRVELYPTMEGNEKYLDDEEILSQIRSSENTKLQVPVSQDCQ